MSLSPGEAELDQKIDPNLGRNSALFTEMIRKGRSLSGLERNCAFLNLGNRNKPEFAFVSATMGLDFDDDGRAVSVVDWEGDGDLDLWIRNRNAPQLRLMKNTSGRAAGSFLAVKLIGNGIDTNRDAVGARVEVVLDNKEEGRLVRAVRAGEGFLSQSSKWLHFGLGEMEANSIEKVIVHWPTRGGGKIETLSGIDPNTRIQIVQGEGTHSLLPMRQLAEKSLPEKNQPLASKSHSVRIPSVSRLPWPAVRYRKLSGEETVHTSSSEGFSLVMVFASWCEACQAEMKDFAAAEKNFREANIDVMAFSVEDLDGGIVAPASLDAVKRLINEIGFPFQTGFLDREQLGVFQTLNDFQTRIHPDIPVPTCFLVSPEQQIIAMYKGRVGVSQIVADAKSADATFLERRQRALAHGGGFIPSTEMEESAIQREANFHRYAAEKLYKKSKVTALAFAKESIKHDPNSIATREFLIRLHLETGDMIGARSQLTSLREHPLASESEKGEAAYKLGLITLREDSKETAVEWFETAVSHEPNHANALNNLAYLIVNRVDSTESEKMRSVQLAEKAVQLSKYTQPNFLDTLATAYEKTGRSDLAILHYKKALALAQASGDVVFESKIEAKMSLIEAE